MDTELDDLLATSAPLGHQRTPDVTAALAQLIDDTERVSVTRPRRRLALLGASAVAVVAIGGAGAAAAAGVLSWGHGWWDDPAATTHEVAGCRLSYAPRAVRDPEHPVSAPDRAAAIAAATEILRRYDETALAGLSGDAASDALNEYVTDELARQGLSTHAVSVALATDCPTGTEQ